MGYNSMVKHQHYAEAVKPETKANKSAGVYGIPKFNEVDESYINALNYKPAKIILCNHPEMVDSRNLYYKTEWVSEYKFLSLKNRWGKSCKLLKKKGNK